MKIVSKNYSFTGNNEPKYLVYLQAEDGTNSETYDVIGYKNLVNKEIELLDRYPSATILHIDYRTYQAENGILSEGYPLILCIYLDKELMANEELFFPVYDSVNYTIKEKNANILTFFLPCDFGKERIECINPVVVPQIEMDRINEMVNEIKTRFSIGD